MKKRSLAIGILPVLFLSGCMSKEAVYEAIDEKIAANNSGVFEPALAEFEGDLAEQREILIDHFKYQKAFAEEALGRLSSEPILEETFTPPMNDSE